MSSMTYHPLVPLCSFRQSKTEKGEWGRRGRGRETSCSVEVKLAFLRWLRFASSFLSFHVVSSAFLSLRCLSMWPPPCLSVYLSIYFSVHLSVRGQPFHLLHMEHADKHVCPSLHFLLTEVDCSSLIFFCCLSLCLCPLSFSMTMLAKP